MDVPDHLIFVKNTINLCMVLIASRDCITILQLYSMEEHMQNTIVIGHLSDREHFIVVTLSLNFTLNNYFFNL